MGGMEVGRWNGDNAVGGGSAFSEHVRIHQRQRFTVQIGQNWAELSALIRAELGRLGQCRCSRQREGNGKGKATGSQRKDKGKKRKAREMEGQQYSRSPLERILIIF